ncbi:MAG: PIN domain nuclease [Actinobacteria bacterium]|jgi:predicted nucleic acid-binding protein|nr:PIN domain nuclease [Actinomycetota bacterium]MBE3114357.1 PIN domain nuclease [Actinomycetota bacterium]
MVLVDTSVLIDYLIGNENEKIEKFNEILNLDIPFGINFYIYQELLQGTKTEKDFNLLKRYMNSQRFFYLKNGKDSYAKAAKIYFDCKKKGLNISSTIDCIIAQICIENNLYLLHNDKDFEMMSQVININFY